MATRGISRFRAAIILAFISILPARPLAASSPAARQADSLDTNRCATLNVTDNEWHRAMFILAGNTGSIYCDGSKLASQDGIFARANTPTELLIGADFNQWRDRVQGRFVGIIDEIRISDISRPWSNDSLVADEHTMALWHFDEAGGDTVYDSSQNRLKGYIYRCKRTADGFRGGAIEFTGEGYIVVPDSDALTKATLCIEVAFRTAHKHEDGYPSPVLIAKYIDGFPRLSEYCAYISAEGGRGLGWTGYGDMLCACPPWR
jgi:hypothetical protein